ncbi:unnamed protein product [Ectocarpus sp. 8 AP-2014]
MPRSVVFRRRRLYYCFFLSSALFYSKFSIRALVLKTSTKNRPTLDQTSSVHDPDSYKPNPGGALPCYPPQPRYHRTRENAPRTNTAPFGETRSARPSSTTTISAAGFWHAS